MFDNQTQEVSTAVLAAVDLGEYDVDISLAELAELAATMGIQSAAELVQKRDSLERATAIGAGKLAELALCVQNTGADLVIFDCELTAVQLRNIEEACGVPVLDRTMLILEIFASRARSREGKLQVELARNRYLLPRLTGVGTALSRLGGGGGGAGAGAAPARGRGGARAKPSWSWTGGICAAESPPWNNSLGSLPHGGTRCAAVAKRMKFPPSPLWDTPTWASPPCSTR